MSPAEIHGAQGSRCTVYSVVKEHATLARRAGAQAHRTAGRKTAPTYANRIGET